MLNSVLGAMGSRTVVVKGLEPCGKRNKQRTGRDFEFTLSEHANGFWSRSETSSVLACGYYSWCCCWVILSSTRRAHCLWLASSLDRSHRAGCPRLCINAQTFVRAFRFLPVKLAASGSKLRFITVQFGGPLRAILVPGFRESGRVSSPPTRFSYHHTHPSLQPRPGRNTPFPVDRADF